MEPNAKYCYPENESPQTATFWGGNSLLRKYPDNSGDDTKVANPLATIPSDSRLFGFVMPIYSTGGMLETTRLANPSISQCQDYTYQYTLKQPYQLHGWKPNLKELLKKGRWDTAYGYPHNTKGTHFACDSEVDIVDGNRTIFEGIDESQKEAFWWERKNENDYTIRPKSIFEEMALYASQPKCFVGSLIVDGKIQYRAENTCDFSTPWIGLPVNGKKIGNVEVEETNYRDIRFHTIDGFAEYVSPTEAEIEAAKKNKATPNLPVNVDGYVEFYSKKGNVFSVTFPNFFRDAFDEKSLRDQSQTVWKNIIDKENTTTQSPFDAQIATTILQAKDLPNDFDWNAYITDEERKRLEEAKAWLVPDIATRQQLALADMLSREGGNRGAIVPNKNSKYEIAYLGLSRLEDKQNRNANSDLSSDNAEKMARIRGLNVTNSANALANTDASHTANTSVNADNADQCGPPDGVALTKWPSAVQCWIKNQLPPKILAGSCGPNTIGKHKHQLPTLNISHASESEQESIIRSENTKVLPQFARKHLGYRETGNVSVSLQNDKNTIAFDSKVTARVKVLSLESDGKSIPVDQYSAFFRFNPPNLIFTGDKSHFSWETFDKNFHATAQIIYTIVLKDGKIIEKESAPFTIAASSEFLDIALSDVTGKPLVSLYADNNKENVVSVIKKKNAIDDGTMISDYTLDIVDDITGEKLVQNGQIVNGKFSIPDSIAKNMGVYRIFVRDNTGAEGEMTFAVKSGNLAKIELKPSASRMMIGRDNIVTLSLLDATGNALSADVHTVEFSISGGKILQK